jgi:hypothetical protein
MIDRPTMRKRSGQRMMRSLQSENEAAVAMRPAWSVVVGEDRRRSKSRAEGMRVAACDGERIPFGGFPSLARRASKHAGVPGKRQTAFCL